MSLGDDVDVLLFVFFAAGFFAGGMIMIRLITRSWPAHRREHHLPTGYAVAIGAAAGTGLALLVGRTPVGPLIMGLIVGCLAIVRARLT